MQISGRISRERALGRKISHRTSFRDVHDLDKTNAEITRAIMITRASTQVIIVSSQSRTSSTSSSIYS